MVWQEEEDFYVRYFTLQILTALLMNSQNRYIFLQSINVVPSFYLYSVESFVDGLFRLQEAILTTPRGITRLMDMLMDREVTAYYILDILNVAIGLFKSLVSLAFS